MLGVPSCERRDALFYAVAKYGDELVNVRGAFRDDGRPGTGCKALFCARKPASRPMTSTKKMRLCEFVVPH